MTFSNNVLPPKRNKKIGTATNGAINVYNNDFLIDLIFSSLNQIDGVNTTKVRNQPAPNGKGKYRVQNEFGTVFENKN